MNEILGLVAYLALPLIGSFVWRLDGVRRLNIGGRLAIAGAAGALTTAVILSLITLAAFPWSRGQLVFFLGIAAILGMWKAPARVREKLPRTPARICIVVLLLITAYGLLTARETTGDLLFFWGPKGVHFASAAKLDLEFLRDANTYLMHRDYPPLVPLLFAWSNTLSGAFAWWAAVLLSGLCLAGMAALVRAHTRDDLSALLVVSILAWTFASARVAGGADPILLFFECVAVSALLFLRDEESQTIVASIGIAGAVITKVEGASFAIAVILALVIERWPWKRIARTILPAAILLGAWLFFIIDTGLLDTYRGPGSAFSLRYLRETLRGTIAYGSYGSFWMVWIAPIVVVLLGNIRRARLALSIATLTLGATLYVYLKAPGDPSTFWIPSSAQRVLLTPLLMLLLAAAAAHDEEASRALAVDARDVDADYGQVASADTSVTG